MSSLIDNASGGLVVGAVMGSVALGQAWVQRDFLRKVDSELSPFPIILKPYRWMIVVSHLICGAWLLLASALIVFCPGTGAKILGGISLVTLSFLWFSVFQGARQFIRIDPDGFSYVKSRSRSIEVKAQFVEQFFAPPIGGNIVIVIKYAPRRVLIPIMFQDINLLNYFLTRWRMENGKRQRMQEDLRSRALSNFGGD